MLTIFGTEITSVSQGVAVVILDTVMAAFMLIFIGVFIRAGWDLGGKK